MAGPAYALHGLRLFYDGTFSPAAYRAWLDRWASAFTRLTVSAPREYRINSGSRP